MRVVRDTMSEYNMCDNTSVISFAIECIPECGSNDEVLTAHGLTTESILKAVKKIIN